MIHVTDLRKGSCFELDGQPWLVVRYKHKVLGRKKAHVKLTVRNLKTGRTGERTFLSDKKLTEIDLEKRDLIFKYFDGREYHFQLPASAEEFAISADILGSDGNFLKKDQSVKVFFWSEQPLSIELPASVNLMVKETSPGIRGDTTTNVYKPARLENGSQVKIPLFVNSGDIIKIDTRSGTYIERISH